MSVLLLGHPARKVKWIKENASELLAMASVFRETKESLEVWEFPEEFINKCSKDVNCKI